MYRLNIRDLIDLVVTAVPDAEAKIQKIYEWHVQREMEVAKWALGVTVTVTVALVVPYWKNELPIGSWVLIAILSIISLPTVYGVYRLMALKALPRKYIAALKLYRQLSSISPFITRYRSEKE